MDRLGDVWDLICLLPVIVKLTLAGRRKGKSAACKIKLTIQNFSLF
jgi:hypothetical protein